MVWSCATRDSQRGGDKQRCLCGTASREVGVRSAIFRLVFVCWGAVGCASNASFGEQTSFGAFEQIDVQGAVAHRIFGTLDYWRVYAVDRVCSDDEWGSWKIGLHDQGEAGPAVTRIALHSAAASVTVHRVIGSPPCVGDATSVESSVVQIFEDAPSVAVRAVYCPSTVSLRAPARFSAWYGVMLDQGNPNLAVLREAKDDEVLYHRSSCYCAELAADSVIADSPSLPRTSQDLLSEISQKRGMALMALLWRLASFLSHDLEPWLDRGMDGPSTGSESGDFLSHDDVVMAEWAELSGFIRILATPDVIARLEEVSHRGEHPWIDEYAKHCASRLSALSQKGKGR